ncbi:hypothetical protein RSAG8_11162, partial [Rhizoctonia solani AG-8 WAC10335]
MPNRAQYPRRYGAQGHRPRNHGRGGIVGFLMRNTNVSNDTERVRAEAERMRAQGENLRLQERHRDFDPPPPDYHLPLGPPDFVPPIAPHPPQEGPRPVDQPLLQFLERILVPILGGAAPVEVAIVQENIAPDDPISIPPVEPTVAPANDAPSLTHTPIIDPALVRDLEFQADEVLRLGNPPWESSYPLGDFGNYDYGIGEGSCNWTGPNDFMDLTSSQLEEGPRFDASAELSRPSSLGAPYLGLPEGLAPFSTSRPSVVHNQLRASIGPSLADTEFVAATPSLSPATTAGELPENRTGLTACGTPVPLSLEPLVISGPSKRPSRADDPSTKSTSVESQLIVPIERPATQSVDTKQGDSNLPTSCLKPNPIPVRRKESWEDLKAKAKEFLLKAKGKAVEVPDPLEVPDYWEEAEGEA